MNGKGDIALTKKEVDIITNALRSKIQYYERMIESKKGHADYFNAERDETYEVLCKVEKEYTW